MLDLPNKYIMEELKRVMKTVLTFRSIVKKYFINQADDADDSDIPMENEIELRNRKKNEEDGIGLLKVQAQDFSKLRLECSSEFKRLKKKYKATMHVTMDMLKRTQHKPGEISFLKEAYVKLNFNQYYTNDDE